MMGTNSYIEKARDYEDKKRYALNDKWSIPLFILLKKNKWFKTNKSLTKYNFGFDEESEAGLIPSKYLQKMKPRTRVAFSKIQDAIGAGMSAGYALGRVFNRKTLCLEDVMDEWMENISGDTGLLMDLKEIYKQEYPVSSFIDTTVGVLGGLAMFPVGLVLGAAHPLYGPFIKKTLITED